MASTSAPIFPTFSGLNPQTTTIDNTAIQELLKNWFKASFNVSRYIAGNPTTDSIDTIVNIPCPPHLATIQPSGGNIPKTNLCIQGTSATLKHYAHHFAIDRVKYKFSPGLEESFEAIFRGIATAGYTEVIVEKAVMDALASNASLPWVDNSAAFATNHPVDPNDPSVINPFTGLNYQANLIANKPLSAANLTSGIISLRQLVWPNGVPILPKNITLFVTPANEQLGRHLATSEFLGFAATFAASDSAGSHSNPFKALFAAGTTMNVEVMNKYPMTVGGLSTDWFLGTNEIPPFVVKSGGTPTITRIEDPTSYGVAYNNEIVIDYKLDLGCSLTHPLAMLKFTA